MSENKATLEAVMGFEAGYEKGVRDMWEAMKSDCAFNMSEYSPKKCWHGVDEEKYTKKCTFETCPIAQKLLKAVK